MNVSTKTLFILILVVSLARIGKCQSIQADITVHFYEVDSGTTEAFKGYDSVHVGVEEILYISNWDKDSIELSLVQPDWLVSLLSQIVFKNILLYVRKSDNESWTPIQYVYSYPEIKLSVPISSCQIKVSYSHLPCAMLRHWYNLPHFNAIIKSDGDWFFTHPLMSVRLMQIRIPPSGYTLFLNKPAVTMGDSIREIFFDETDDRKISIILIKEKWYQKQVYNDEKYQLNLYHWDSTYHMYTPDTVRIHRPISQSIMENRLKKACMILKRYGEFFPQKGFMSINLVDNNLETNGIIWGCSFQEKGWDTLSVFFDSHTGWDGNMIQHEILHGYLDILPPKGDSAYLFFCEAMTEYLSVALFNSQEKTDSILRHYYKTRYLDYRKIEDEESIFRIQDDYMRPDFSGTAPLIYQKTPLAIHQFGLRIGGQECLLHILRLFYAEVYHKKECSMRLLKDIFLSNSVTEDQWGRFIYDLSHSL